MSGHRRQPGQKPKPTRAASRIAEHKRRVHAAPTGKAQAAAAFDRARSAAARAPDAESAWYALATLINDHAVSLESGVAA